MARTLLGTKTKSRLPVFNLYLDDESTELLAYSVNGGVESSRPIVVRVEDVEQFVDDPESAYDTFVGGLLGWMYPTEE